MRNLETVSALLEYTPVYSLSVTIFCVPLRKNIRRANKSAWFKKLSGSRISAILTNWNVTFFRAQAKNGDNYSSADFKHFHDIRVVRASQIQKRSSCGSDTDKLADSVSGILFSGSCKPYRARHIHHRAVKNHTGSHNARCVLRVFGSLPQRGNPLELYCGFRVYGNGCLLCFQKMVKTDE